MMTIFSGERSIADAKQACTNLVASSSLPLPTSAEELSDFNLIVDGLVTQGKFTRDKTVALGGTKLAQDNDWKKADGRKEIRNLTSLSHIRNKLRILSKYIHAIVLGREPARQYTA